MKLFSCRKTLIILTLLLAGISSINCGDPATITSGTSNPSQNDEDVADTGTPEGDTGASEDTVAPDTQTPDAAAPDTCTSNDYSSCIAPTNSHAVGCTLGSCAFECDAGSYDANQDLGAPNSDGCEYTCSPTNGGEEACDGLDNNCDTQIDEGLSGTYYKDADGDGFGQSDDPVQGCDPANGYTIEQGDDCDDTEANIYPGAPIIECATGTDYNCNQRSSCAEDNCNGQSCGDQKTCANHICLASEEAEVDPVPLDPVPCSETNGGIEICDGLDNDCDGGVDEGLNNTHYRDDDGDGYPDINEFLSHCDADLGYIFEITGIPSVDCNDNNADIHPGAPTLECVSATDYNCNNRAGCSEDPQCAGMVCDENGTICGWTEPESDWIPATGLCIPE